jgi:DNA polymerase-3 subunit beta
VEANVVRSTLADETNWASRVIAQRPTSPILNGLLIEAMTDNTLRLSAAGPSSSSSTTIEGEVIVPGSAVVPGKLLAAITHLLPQKPVSLKLDDTKLILSCGKSNFTIPTFPLDEYPALPQQPDQIGTITGEEFTEAVGQVAFAAAKDDVHPILTGVQIKCIDHELTLIATDRYRLAVKKVPWKGATREPFLLKARNLTEITKPAYPGMVQLSLDNSTTLFGVTAGTRRSTMTMLDNSNFPDVERLMPTDGSTSITFNIAEMVEAVKRVRLVMDRPNQPLRFTFGNDEVLLAAEGGPAASASETVAGQLEGERVIVAFNPDYLVEGLLALGDQTGRLQLNGPTRPVLLDAPADKSYNHVLMPVRVEN